MEKETKEKIEIINLIDQLSLWAGNKITRSEAHKKNVCVKCNKKIEGFKDEISKKEYQLSGFCQKCQDSFFGDDS